MRKAAVLMALLLAAPAAAADLTGAATVIDGDTLEIHGQRIRLHGIDAPEQAQHCRYAGTLQRCGQQAANALADRIGRRTVTCEARDTDRYGRVVAVCRAGGEDLNAWMVRAGWALAYTRYSRDYLLDEQAAAQDLVGIWRYEFEPPWEYRAAKRKGG